MGLSVIQFRSIRQFRLCGPLSLLAFLLVSAAPVRAEKTLMILVDWWLDQPMDTIINLKVYQPTSEIKMVDGSTVPNPVLTNAYTTEDRSFWYSLSQFNPDDYVMGRVRFNTTYLRGWYQNDSTYKVAAGDTVFFPDTQTTITYQVTASGRSYSAILRTDTTVKFFVFDSAATYRGPKLYTSAGNAGTDVLNMRPTDAKGVLQAGALDKCIDTIPSDTIWLRWGTPAAPPGQTASAAGMQCTGYNPFSTRAALVYLRNPWPGTDQPVVEFNGQNIPMFPSTNADWLVADLRYIKSEGTPANTIRFKKSKESSVYFDSAGVEQGVVKPFVLANFGNAVAYYFVPPEAGAPLVTGTVAAGKLPNPSYTLYVQNPWSPGTPRLLWESDKNYHVTRPSGTCGWYTYPLYAAPTKVLIGHSFEDSIYGAKGVQFRTRDNWIEIPASAIQTTKTPKEVWIQTMDASKARIPAVATATPEKGACLSDQLTLVMEAFDFKGRGETGGNPSFQIGGPTDLDGKTTSTGLAKGMVLSTLSDKGLPVQTGRDSGYQSGGIYRTGPSGALPLAQSLWGTSHPGNWFDTTALKTAVSGIAIGHGCVELGLPRIDSGYYFYENKSFFPLDTISDKRGVSMLTAADKLQHNFLYCMHGHASFEYTPGLKFEFKGDDDVWVFINNKLAVDLGGTHSPESASVSLDKMKLREGTVYPFDIFYCERQTNGSTIRIKTSMDLQPSWKYRVIPSSDGSKIKMPIEGQVTKNFVPSCADLLSTQELTWTSTAGRMVVIGPDGSEMHDIYTDSVTLYGGNLIFTGTDIVVDTTKLKLESKLMWPGVYTIRAESRLGDSLYSISFTKSYGSVVVSGKVLDFNGDGVADSIQLSATRGIFAAADNPSYSVVWFDAAGKKDSIALTATGVRTISDSAVMAPLSAKSWGEQTRIPAGVVADSNGAVYTHPGGLVDAIVNPIKLVDGIAPVADSAYLKYDESGVASDSLFVWASEPLAENALTTPALAGWALIGSSATPRLLTDSAQILAGGARFVILLNPSTNPVVAGDSLRLGGFAGDASHNAPGAVSKWVLIQANPVAKSWMLDVNGDGAPDSVGISSKGDLSKADSVRVQWKTASGADTVVSVITSGGVGTGLKLPANILQNATTCTGCRIEVFQAGSSKKFPLADSVAAVALSASYRFGPTLDTLVVKVSEALQQGNAVGENLFAQKLASAAPGGLGTLIVGGLADLADPTVVKLLVSPGVVTGDSLRLRGWSLDLFKNAPGAVSPFVKIDYGPQPIKVVVWDRNGDGTIDSVAYTLLRSSAGYDKVSGFGLTWGGKAATVGTLVNSADHTTWSGPVTSAEPLTTMPAATDGGWLVVGTDVTSYRASVDDSVAPVAKSARLIYGFETGSADTVEVIGTEDLGVVGGGIWAMLGKDSASATPTLIKASDVSNASSPVLGGFPTHLKLAVPSGSISNDAGWVRYGTGISDKFTVVGVSSRWVPLEITPSGRTYLFDSDGDGRADSLSVAVRGAFGDATSVTITWGNAAGASVSKDWPVAPGVGTFGVHPADASLWFEKGATSCPGTCTAVFKDATGNVVATWQVVDNVAPMLLKGTYSFGGAQDTLKAKFSEPLKALDKNGTWIEWGKIEVGGALIHVSVDPSGDGATFVIDSAKGAHEGWDSLRAAAGNRSGALSDSSGTKTGETSPWAPVEYGLPPMVAKLLDPNGEGRGTHVEVRLIRQVPAAATAGITSFQFDWTDSAGSGTDRRTVAVGSLAETNGVWSGALATPFALGATGCSGTSCGAVAIKSGSQRGMALLDGVPPSLIWAKYRFSLQSVAKDTLVVGLSEPWKGGAVGDLAQAFVLVGTQAVPLSLAPLHSWSLSADNSTLSMVVDTIWGSEKLSRNDSSRLVKEGRVVDDAGNVVGEKSRWVPIEFGLRPPQLNVVPWPTAVLKNSAGNGGTVWTEPNRAEVPGLELLVRDPSEMGAKDPYVGWKRIEGVDAGTATTGGEPKNNVKQMLGVKIRLNRPLEGTMIVYDNIGISVLSVDLDPLKSLWNGTNGTDDEIRDVWIAWNGTGPDGKFAASGVYIFRAVVKVDQGDGNKVFRNLIWKLGWHRDTK
jgi:fibro-slime domain-containing protein